VVVVVVIAVPTVVAVVAVPTHEVVSATQASLVVVESPSSHWASAQNSLALHEVGPGPPAKHLVTGAVVVVNTADVVDVDVDVDGVVVMPAQTVDVPSHLSPMVSASPSSHSRPWQNDSTMHEF
jgi:hypothetical protein